MKNASRRDSVRIVDFDQLCPLKALASYNNHAMPATQRMIIKAGNTETLRGEMNSLNAINMKFVKRSDTFR